MNSGCSCWLRGACARRGVRVAEMTKITAKRPFMNGIMSQDCFTQLHLSLHFQFEAPRLPSRNERIPEGLTIKPVETIAGAVIEINNDIGLSPYAGDSASAFVEVMLRRKYWD